VVRDKELKLEDVEASHMCSSLAFYWHSTRLVGLHPPAQWPQDETDRLFAQCIDSFVDKEVKR
jgi:hypothetical protein